MDRNDSNLNPKQRELVERLEEIRRHRSGQTQSDVEGTERSLEQPVDSKTKDRNRPRPRQSMSRPQTKKAQNQRRNERVSQRKRDEIRDSTIQSQEIRSLESTSGLSDDSFYSNRERAAKSRKKARSKKKAKKSNHLIKQLSDGHKLADAIILSEVLSKPVALKKRYR